jgi:hypothetical protein
MPDFVKGELKPYYDQTELEFLYVHAHCLKMGATKMIDISLQTIKGWYEQMLLNNWTKKIFLIRLEAVTRASVFNRIDWNDWIKQGTDTYGLFEIEIRVRKQVDNLIQKGRTLRALAPKFMLTPDETKYVELAASQEIEREQAAERYRFIDQEKEAIKVRLRSDNRLKRAQLTTLSDAKKTLVIAKCFREGIFKEEEESLFNTYVENIGVFADIIPLHYYNQI